MNNSFQPVPDQAPLRNDITYDNLVDITAERYGSLNTDPGGQDDYEAYIERQNTRIAQENAPAQPSPNKGSTQKIEPSDTRDTTGRIIDWFEERGVPINEGNIRGIQGILDVLTTSPIDIFPFAAMNPERSKRYLETVANIARMPEAAMETINRAAQPDATAMDRFEAMMAVAGLGSGARIAAGARSAPNQLDVFAGPVAARRFNQQGRTTMSAALDLARKLEAEGVSVGDITRRVNKMIDKSSDANNLGSIRKNTEGEWQVEISDRGGNLSGHVAQIFNKDHAGGPISLPFRMTFDHPQLLGAYPEFRNIQVILRRGRLSGGTSADGGTIVVTAPTAKEARSVILHEVQHIVQRSEGFSGGARPKQYFNRDNIGGVFSTSGGYIDAVKNIPGHVLPQVENAIMEVARGYWGERGLTGNTLNELREFISRNPEFNTPNLRQAFATEVNFRIYQRHAGEVEAELVRARGALSGQQRREFPPDDADIIVPGIGRRPQQVGISRERQIIGPSTPIDDSPEMVGRNWRPHGNLSDQRIQAAPKVLEMYEAGKTIRDIAKEVGLANGTVLRILQEYGIETRPAGFQRRDITEEMAVRPEDEISYLRGLEESSVRSGPRDRLFSPPGETQPPPITGREGGPPVIGPESVPTRPDPGRWPLHLTRERLDMIPRDTPPPTLYISENMPTVQLEHIQDLHQVVMQNINTSRLGRRGLSQQHVAHISRRIKEVVGIKLTPGEIRGYIRSLIPGG